MTPRDSRVVGADLLVAWTGGHPLNGVQRRTWDDFRTTILHRYFWYTLSELGSLVGPQALGGV
jgi:hypothetical protein